LVVASVELSRPVPELPVTVEPAATTMLQFRPMSLAVNAVPPVISCASKRSEGSSATSRTRWVEASR
jgi:hypothetical protein